MIIHCDGSCYAKDRRMGVGIAFFEDDSDIPFREESITIPGLGSSNEAEYHAIINALDLMIHNYYTLFYGRKIIINTDSQLIHHQITGEFQCTKINLQRLLKEVYMRLDYLRADIKFGWIPRSHPKQQIVDKLSKRANPYYNLTEINEATKS